MVKKEVQKDSVKFLLKNNLDLVSYIFGVISIITAFLSQFGLEGILFSIVGLVFIKGQKTKLAEKAKVLNLIGLIVGCIVFVLSLLISIFFSGALSA